MSSAKRGSADKESSQEPLASLEQQTAAVQSRRRSDAAECKGGLEGGDNFLKCPLSGEELPLQTAVIFGSS